MNLIFFRAKDYTNFGDELNPYIFHHFFPDFFNQTHNDKINFYGIGTIIDSRINSEEKNIIFGTGIRDITIPYDKKKWDVRFLRGPISSNVLGYNGEKFIADAAYCMLCDKTLLPQNKIKKYEYSFMPHYRQMDKINWNLIERITGIHIIDPRKSLSYVFEEIAQTKKLLTIAMHGAIVADLLRIPWLRIKMEAIGSEPPVISDIKWLDFLLALNLKDEYIQIKNYYPYSRKYSIKSQLTHAEIIYKIEVACKKGKFQLTNEKQLSAISAKLNDEIYSLKTKYH